MMTRRPSTLLLPLLLLSATAASITQASNGLRPSQPGQYSSPLISEIEAKAPDQRLKPRVRGFHNLGNGMTFHYNTFSTFEPNWLAALSLSYFWSEIALQVSNTAWMPDDNFLDNTLGLRMSFGGGAYSGGADLVFEDINFEWPVSRDLVKLIAVSMMEYTLKGFCGMFNASLSRGLGTGPIWVVLRLKGLSEMAI